MKILNKFLLFAMFLMSNIGCTQSTPSIRFGLFVQGVIEGERDSGRHFYDLLYYSDYSFWELNKTFFRIDYVQLLRLNAYKINKNKINITGSIYYRVGKGQIFLISKFNKEVQIKLSPYGKIMSDSGDLYIEVINDGSIKNKIENHKNGELVVEIDSPIKTSFSVKQAPKFGTGD
ncbi:MAG TPA: hypothetical protein VGJ89_06050 [Geothrix sp.]|jgi:hypothetical protein